MSENDDTVTMIAALVRGDRLHIDSIDLPKVPYGEKPCDIWTLARHELFCDDPPTYIKMPRILRDCWLDYAEAVRRLCIAAIERRITQRLYIQWLEIEIAKLARTAPGRRTFPAQLILPFADSPTSTERSSSIDDGVHFSQFFSS